MSFCFVVVVFSYYIGFLSFFWQPLMMRKQLIMMYDDNDDSSIVTNSSSISWNNVLLKKGVRSKKQWLQHKDKEGLSL